MVIDGMAMVVVKNDPSITNRIKQPTPDDVRFTRESIGLTATEAGRMVSSAANAYSIWSSYETKGQRRSRQIPLATWELFLLLNNRHPIYRMARRLDSDCANQRCYLDQDFSDILDEF